MANRVIMESWSNQYKHPEWQKKRLEVMEVNGFRCACCESTEAQLHVHHKAYIKGRKIWEYAVDELRVLCDECHEIEHLEKDVLNKVFLRMDGVSPMECAALLFNFVGASVHPDDPIEQGLNSFDITLIEIGKFARVSHEYDIESIKTILSLTPEEFRATAEFVRGNNG